MGPGAVDWVQRRSGPEYPGRQDCVTIPQTSERVGDLALVKVSRRAAPNLAPGAPAAVCSGPVLDGPRDEKATSE